MSIVYFIQAGDGPIKIGTTDNLENRKTSLQTANHEKIIVLHMIDPAQYSKINAKDLEKYYHKYFKYQHIRGEWYRPDKYLLDCIDKMKSGYDFSEEWVEHWNKIEEHIRGLTFIAREYRETGNYHAIKYITGELCELIDDFNRGAY